MKTNISGLMTLIKDYEEKLNNLEATLDMHYASKKIIELNKQENVIEDYKDDFKNELLEYEKLTDRITYLKNILYEKNNEFKLSDGRSIQTSIANNNNLRKLKTLYEDLLLKRNTKTRVTEVNNSYFEVNEVNFDVNEIKEKLKKVEEKIYQTDFEISKLNSIEFEIED